MGCIKEVPLFMFGKVLKLISPGWEGRGAFYLSKGILGAGSGFWHGKPNYSLVVKVFIAILTT